MSNDIGEIRERLARLEVGQENTTKAVDDGFKMMGTKLDAMDTRLRGVETKSASFGAVAGGIIALGVTLAKDALTGKA